MPILYSILPCKTLHLSGVLLFVHSYLVTFRRNILITNHQLISCLFFNVFQSPQMVIINNLKKSRNSHLIFIEKSKNICERKGSADQPIFNLETSRTNSDQKKEPTSCLFNQNVDTRHKCHRKSHF